MAQASVLPSGGTPILEREAQVAALEALAGAARSGGGRFVVIEGSAGIGKTRLLAEARAIAGSAEMRVLAARGGEFEGEFAYGIVRQLFEPLLASAAPDLRAELLSGPAALVEPLLGASQSAPSQDAPPAEGSFAILHGLYWLAANVAFHQPTLLAVDDLHWADTPSLRWLLYLTRRLEECPSSSLPQPGRPRARAAIPRSLQSSSPIRKPPRFAPNRLAVPRSPHSRRSCTVWSPTRPSAPPSRRQAKPAIHRCGARRGCTGGNQPAGHVPRLLEIGAKGVSRAVGLRLARLPPEALALLRAASILGDGTELRHAAAPPAWKASEPAARPRSAGSPPSGGSAQFFHPVVRAAVYETLDVVERGAAHRAAAELLLQVGAPPECGGAPSPRRPTSRLVRGLDAPPSGRADTCPGRGRARGRISDSRARRADRSGYAGRCWSSSALRSGGRTARQRPTTCVPVWSSSPTGRGAARSRSSLAARSGWTESRMPLRSSSRRLRRRIERDPDLYELLLAELISSAWWDPQTYPSPKHRSASSTRMRSTEASVAKLCSRRWLITSTGWGCTASCLELARRALAPRNLLASGSIAFYYAVNLLPRSGLLAEAVSIFDRAVAQARRRGDILNVAFRLMWRGYWTRRGDLRAAVADLREALDLSAAHGMLVAWAHNIGFLAQALLEQGRRTRRRA